MSHASNTQYHVPYFLTAHKFHAGSLCAEARHAYLLWRVICLCLMLHWMMSHCLSGSLFVFSRRFCLACVSRAQWWVTVWLGLCARFLEASVWLECHVRHAESFPCSKYARWTDHPVDANSDLGGPTSSPYRVQWNFIVNAVLHIIDLCNDRLV